MPKYRSDLRERSIKFYLFEPIYFVIERILENMPQNPFTPNNSQGDDAPDHVALFIDWDNLVISNYADRGANRPNLDVIIAKAQQYGTVVVARAYAEWLNMQDRLEVYKSGVETIYAPVFHAERDLSGQTSKGKSLADPVMVTDCIDFLHLLPSVGTYVMVTGDKDMIPVVRIARLRGRRVVVIGPDYVANILQQMCDEFIPYRVLLAQAASVDPMAAYYQQQQQQVIMSQMYSQQQAANNRTSGAATKSRLANKRGGKMGQPYASVNVPPPPPPPSASTQSYNYYNYPNAGQTQYNPATGGYPTPQTGQTQYSPATGGYPTPQTGQTQYNPAGSYPTSQTGQTQYNPATGGYPAPQTGQTGSYGQYYSSQYQPQAGSYPNYSQPYSLPESSYTTPATPATPAYGYPATGATPTPTTPTAATPEVTPPVAAATPPTPTTSPAPTPTGRGNSFDDIKEIVRAILTPTGGGRTRTNSRPGLERRDFAPNPQL
jgi:uncharacterized LabA/DUF88 family protein